MPASIDLICRPCIKAAESKAVLHDLFYTVIVCRSICTYNINTRFPPLLEYLVVDCGVFYLRHNDDNAMLLLFKSLKKTFYVSPKYWITTPHGRYFTG
jgi:hypothetical protein